MSAGVRPKPASRSGRIQIRIAGRASPPMNTRATPSSEEKRSSRLRSTQSESCSRDQPGLEIDQEHDRGRVGVDLPHHRRLDLGRQVAGGGADPVADVVGGGIDVAAGDELDRDVRLAVARARGDRLQPLQPGELLLEHLGDAGLDHIGGGADIAGVDRDDRRVDVGIFAHRQAEEADQPDHRHQHRDHRREDGPLDR